MKSKRTKSRFCSSVSIAAGAGTQNRPVFGAQKKSLRKAETSVFVPKAFMKIDQSICDDWGLSGVEKLHQSVWYSSNRLPLRAASLNLWCRRVCCCCFLFPSYVALHLPPRCAHTLRLNGDCLSPLAVVPPASLVRSQVFASPDSCRTDHRGLQRPLVHPKSLWRVLLTSFSRHNAQNKHFLGWWTTSGHFRWHVATY